MDRTSDCMDCDLCHGSYCMWHNEQLAGATSHEECVWSTAGQNRAFKSLVIIDDKKRNPMKAPNPHIEKAKINRDKGRKYIEVMDLSKGEVACHTASST